MPQQLFVLLVTISSTTFILMCISAFSFETMLIINFPIALIFGYFYYKRSSATEKINTMLSKSGYKIDKLFRCDYVNFLAIADTAKVIIIGNTKKMEILPYSQIISWQDEWEKNSKGYYTSITLSIKVKDLQKPLHKINFGSKRICEESCAALNAVLG